MLAFERHGSGEPLVLVHGVTHRRQAWYPVLEQLSEQREVILVDLPGHGQSPDLITNGRPVADVLREEFKQFLDALGLDRPHIGGNSLGGRVALEAAANGHARSATALSPAGFWAGDASFAYTRQMFAAAAAVIGRLGSHSDRLAGSSVGRRLMYSTLMAHPNRVPADVALGDIRGYRRALPALRVLLDQASTFDGVIPLSVPVTIAWAARDLVLPLWQADIARVVVPMARHLTMRGVGHVPMWDDPQMVVEVLLRGSAPTAGMLRVPALAVA